MSVFHIGELHAKPGHVDALIASLEMLKEQSGYISSACYRSSDDENHLSTIEEWRSKEDHQNFVDSIPAEGMQLWLDMLSEPPKGAFFDKA